MPTFLQVLICSLLFVFFKVRRSQGWSHLGHKRQVNKRPHSSPRRCHLRPQEHDPAPGQHVPRWRDAEGQRRKEGVAVPERQHLVGNLAAARSPPTGRWNKRGWSHGSSQGTAAAAAPSAASASLVLSFLWWKAAGHFRRQSQKIVIVSCVSQTQIAASLSGTSVWLLHLNTLTWESMWD